jgi:TRAP-type C4-dicarboxylate transport system permease small subunit
MHGMKKIYDRIEENILFIALVFSVFLIFFQVIMRYIFGNSLSWSEELARYLFIWYTWIGTSLAIRERRHIRIEILTDFLSERAKLRLEIVVLLLWAGFAAFLAVKGVEVGKLLLRSGQSSPALEIPMAFAYAAVPVGCTLMVVRLVGQVREVLRKLAVREA